MKRTTVRIAGAPYLLAQGQDLDDIRQAVVAAARSGADLVRVTVVGNREVEILVTPGVPLTFESEEVPEDAADDGDLDAPFVFPHMDDYTLS
jgi:hypothetical protein